MRIAGDVIGPALQGIAVGEFDELVEAIEDRLTYVNVHSDVFPGGEIRGQLLEADDDDDEVTVGSPVNGRFGFHPAGFGAGLEMVQGFVFDGPATVEISASGAITLFPGIPALENVSPDGTDFIGADFSLTRADFGYVPLEEAAVDGGADHLTFEDVLPNSGALIGAFVSESTVDSAGFAAIDDDFGVPGISPDQLFLIGSGPFEFTATEPGTLFFGINDNRPGNNTGSFSVTISDDDDDD